MLKNEAVDFVESQIKNLFPAWNPSYTESDIWADELMAFDYIAAKSAVHTFLVSEKGSFSRPKLYHILKECKKNQNRVVERQDPVKLFTMRNLDNPQNHKGFYVGCPKEVPDSGEVMLRAEQTKSKFEDLYGGVWIAEIAEGIIEE